MKRLFLVFLLALAACAGGGDEPVRTQAGAFQVAAAFTHDTARQKGNKLRLEVASEGKPIEGAKVDVVATMPAMGAMPEMRSPAKVTEEGGGEYLATFDLPMGGSWSLEVGVEAGGKSAEARYGFTVGSPGLTAAGATAGPGPSAAPTLPARTFDAPVLEALRSAMESYETVRDRLADDTIEGVAEPARAAAESLRRARAGVGDADAALVATLDQGVAAAEALAAAEELATARPSFGDLSRALVMLAECDARLQEGWHIFRCPMAEGFQKWVQRSAELENPYMGRAMSTCGEQTDWRAVEIVGAHEEHAPGEVAYYTCSMHPSVKSETPGTCPLCSMDLTPVTEESLATGVILIDPVRRQKIGVTTAKVERRSLSVPIRAVGAVTYDESALTDVTVRAEGWVEEVYADETGQRVQRGQKLFSLYSPEIFAAQEELLQVSRDGWAGGALDGGFARAARQRLRLWGLTDAQVEAIVARGEARPTVDILAPATGFVVEKDVIAGDQVMPRERLFRIAGLGKVWVEAEVYEQDLPRVKRGQRATVTLPYGGRSFEGKVSRVVPYLTGATRTARVRIELPNEDLLLKPDMFAEVDLHEDAGERLVVPREAVIYTGPRRLVFVDLGEGRLQPREIQVGLRGADEVEVLSGLAEGEVVVTSGNFLVAAESRLRSATDYWGGTVEAE